jgi:N-acetylglucosamine kinase-like BadF-type ATPase
MRYFLGVDVGSSKTHALIVDETGQCVGFGHSAGGNHQGRGYNVTTEAIRESFQQAAQMAGVSGAQVAGAGFGIAGYDWPSELEDHLRCVHEATGLICPLEVVNDGVNGLMAGTTHGWGVNVTAGSGVNVRGRDQNGREGRIVGNGIYFGEYGGGIEIVGSALQEVNYAWIKRTLPTTLTGIFLDATGAKSEIDLMEGLSNGYYHLYPAIAIKIFEAAAAGDEAAQRVIRFSGQELGHLAVAVIHQLNLEDEEVEVVQSGSVFDGGALISDPMREVILAAAPKAKIIRLDAPPVLGSLLLGMEAGGFDGYPLRKQIIATTREWLEQAL